MHNRKFKSDKLNLIINRYIFSSFTRFQNQGTITLYPASLDYETTSQYKLTVTVSDPDGLTDVQVVTVNILDVNEAPVIQNLPDSVTIAEDVAENTAVYTVSTVDQDEDGIVYTMTTSPPSAPFEIDVAGRMHSWC